jgi:hypothetical protein
LPERIECQVIEFEKLTEDYGVVFSDAYHVDENKVILNTFYKRNTLGILMDKVPQGDVFKDVVHSYRICSPTIMIRKSVFDELGGYDENLSYEDYDFFIRSARNYKYHFIDKLLMYKRELKNSNSGAFYLKRNNQHLKSTLIICKKALWLCKSDDEKKALLHSVRYHFRQAFYMNDFDLAKEYVTLIKSIQKLNLVDNLIFFMVKNKINIHWFYIQYLKLKQ